MAVFEINFYSKSLNRHVPLCVILPTDKPWFPGMRKREAGKPYKTLYLLHGVTDNYTNWLYNTRIRRWAEDEDLAVVMPSGDNAFYVNQPWNCNMYSEFIGKELVEFTRKTFPLSMKREDTYIAGLSMGGYGAMKNGLEYHETFGAIATLSGAFIVDEHLAEIPENPYYIIETKEYKQSCFGTDLEAAGKSTLNVKVLIEEKQKEGIEFPQIYMACGKLDSLLPASQEVDACLTRFGIEHTFEIGEGNHEWDFWDTYIKKVLEWLPLEGHEQI